MASLTKDQKAELIKTIDSMFGSAYLLCDSYLVSAHTTRDKQRLLVMVYVNGIFKGEWYRGEAEEAKRFLFKRTRSLYSAAAIKKAEKEIGKRYCKKFGYYEKREYYTPWWNTARTFVNHICRANESIEIIDYKTYERLLNERAETEAAA